ncbi:hypothetical protein M5M_07435 [Simiduia agarivorans SA1 = DSM 21679]|uniref:Solitary outer membrane autotransporter beta-barrel domain-containing protein n=2 Tax=Simiduia TaxID=447467 RepID=K4KKF7_SIMAS|nr:hypothetical protein M5M_07435 [Simiduia agarivorans SA1 = DSM 21679]
MCVLLAPGAMADDRLKLEALDEQAIKRSFIAFIGATSTPGLESAQMSIDAPRRESEISRTGLGFNAEFILPDRIENGFWGAGFIAGTHRDRVELAGPNDETVVLNIEREMQGLRLSYGWSLPLTSSLKIRPYMTTSWMQTQTQFQLTDLSSTAFSESVEQAIGDDVDTVSLAGNLDVEYVLWQGQTQWLLAAQINGMYTDVLNSRVDLVDTDDWTHAHKLGAEARFASPWQWGGRPWRWRVYYHFTDFSDFSRLSLGFTRQHELGAGLDWQLNIRPLGWFGWESVGVQFGVIGGGDLRGVNVGISAR